METLIVKQTSSKHIASLDNGDLPERSLQGDYIREKMRTGEHDDFDIVANMYNGVYGKRAANMKDVLRGVTESRVTSWAKRHGIILTEQDGARLLTLADAVNDMSAEFSDFEADVAFDAALRDIHTHAREDADALFERATNKLEQDRAAIAAKKKARLWQAVEIFAGEIGVPPIERQDLHTFVDTLFPQAYAKEFLRNERKMAEVLELLDIVERHGIARYHHIVDAAGGAGDLGVAIAEKYPSVDVRVVDVVAGLGDYVSYLARNGLDQTTRNRVHFELSPLQDVTVLPSEAEETALVAKHPCGGLKDEIINLAARENVPFLCIMSCCQDKMALHPEVYAKYYGMENDIPGFVHLAKRSARTNIEPEDFRNDEKMYAKKKQERADGFAAMNDLDRRSVDRLRSLGYEVEMETSTDSRIKKGNTIIAKKVL